jgi:hypothetical protein
LSVAPKGCYTQQVTDGRLSTVSQFAAITAIMRMMSKTAIKEREKENYIKKEERKRDGQNARKNNVNQEEGNMSGKTERRSATKNKGSKKTNTERRKETK